MATVSFIEKLKGMKLTDLVFTDFRKEVTSGDGEERMAYLVLTLDKPIDTITSSTSVYDPISDKRAHYTASDVNEVRVKLATIEKFESEFKFEEDPGGKLTGAGTYSGDLFLDLSKGENVWLTDVKFASLSKGFRDKRRTERVAMLLDKKS